MEITSQNYYFGEGWVFHKRAEDLTLQKNLLFKLRHYFFNGKLVNSFKYPIFNIILPIHNDEILQQINSRLFLSINSKDYLDGQSGSLKENLFKFLNLSNDDDFDQIWLQTLPRMMGYIFNPVSFWYLYKNQKLISVLCEVNNTFGDKYFYYLNHLEGKSHFTTETEKRFHVSPFISIDGKYKFDFLITKSLIENRIQLIQNQKIKLDTGLKIQIKEAKNISDFYLLKKYGWLTLLIILRIHYQALKLWLKGASFFSRPTPPNERTTYDKTKN